MTFHQPGSLSRLRFLAGEAGISVEVIDTRTTWRLDKQALIESAKKDYPPGKVKTLLRQCDTFLRARRAQPNARSGQDHLCVTRQPTYPLIYASFSVVWELRGRLAPMPENARGEIIGRNARRFYGLAG